MRRFLFSDRGHLLVYDLVYDLVDGAVYDEIGNGSGNDDFALMIQGLFF